MRDNAKKREERLNAMFDKIESRKVPTNTNRTLKPIIENDMEIPGSLNSSAYIEPPVQNKSQVELVRMT